MPLWKLTPLDLKDPNWEASSHHAMAIIRAPDEETARDEAQKALGVKTGFAPEKGIKAPPWKRANLAKVELIEVQRFDSEGPTEVLEPFVWVATMAGRAPFPFAHM